MGTATKRPSTRGLAITISLAAATVGLVYGYDTGSIAGALSFIPQHFSLSTSAKWPSEEETVAILEQREREERAVRARPHDELHCNHEMRRMMSCAS